MTIVIKPTNAKNYIRITTISLCAFVSFDVCVTAHHWYNNINSQIDATTINFIFNYNQFNMFRAIISPILRSARLCLQLLV